MLEINEFGSQAFRQLGAAVFRQSGGGQQKTSGPGTSTANGLQSYAQYLQPDRRSVCFLADSMKRQ